MGLGLDGELNDKWTRYKSDNAIEANHSWKLHAEPDLGVPLAPSAMDFEGCYKDPSKSNKKQKKNDAFDDELLFDDMDDEKEDEKGTSMVPLDKEDEKLINWTGHMGDSAAEELHKLRDKARAEARLGIKGKSVASILTPKDNDIERRRNDFKSRVLAEQNPFFMKKTTYLANDHSRKVHDFTSLAQTKAVKEEEITKELSSKKSSDKEIINETFVVNNQKITGKRKHPSKENVVAEYEIPLLPDDETWGHGFIHVVLDKLPKDKSIQKQFTDEKLEKAFISDVHKKGGDTERMQCNLLLTDDDNDNDNQYNIVQKYDLEIFHLKEEDKPDTNFLFVVDEEKGIASYHPITSRIQLSSGRPSDETGSRRVTKRALTDEEKADIEEQLAQVDADLAEKYGTNEQMDEDISQHPKSQFPTFGDADSSSDEE